MPCWGVAVQVRVQLLSIADPATYRIDDSKRPAPLAEERQAKAAIDVLQQMVDKRDARLASFPIDATASPRIGAMSPPPSAL